MKCFLNHMNPMNQICFITDVRRDEDTYHVTYADGESLEFPVTEETTNLLESRLEKQVIKGYKKLNFLEHFQKDYFPIVATSILLQEVTTAFLLYHVFHSNESQASYYSSIVYGYVFLNVYLTLYKSKLDNKINVLSSDIEPLLDRMEYKEKLEKFISSVDAEESLGEDIYHRVCSAVEEGKNPFSLIEFNEDKFTGDEVFKIMSVISEDKGFRKKR